MAACLDLDTAAAGFSTLLHQKEGRWGPGHSHNVLTTAAF